MGQSHDLIFNRAGEEQKLFGLQSCFSSAEISSGFETFPFHSFATVYYNKLRVLTSLAGVHCREVKKHDLSDAIVNTMQPLKSQLRQNIRK